tara:strand:+ start:721 stop:1320 length:600 start_codon:yes stop_codon:yes gene_type:complete
MFNSKEYWNTRYVKGDNSGAGSYNNLATFKADVINTFIRDNSIRSIIDYGMGDGNQLKLLELNGLNYNGVDVSEYIVNNCRKEFTSSNLTFSHCDEFDFNQTADLVLSCDVIYHLIEDDVYEVYMNNLFSMSDKYVVIYALDRDVHHCQHVRFRKFSDYIEKNLKEWKMIKHIPNKYAQHVLGKNNDTTSPSDFYIYKK